MSRRSLVLALCVVALAGIVSVSWSPARPGAVPGPAVGASQEDTAGTCAETTSEATGSPDAERVPPGCCTSNCNTNKDCDRICGKGNCVCIASSDCCRRCTY